MNSSSTPGSSAPLIVAEAGVAYTPWHKDPICAWIDLMEVVEALCPRWPVREHGIQGVFLL
jgi:hypothetical protein